MPIRAEEMRTMYTLLAVGPPLTLTCLGFGDGLHKGRRRAGAPRLVGDDYQILDSSSCLLPWLQVIIWALWRGTRRPEIELAVAGARAEMQIDQPSPPSRCLVGRRTTY